MPTRPEPSRKPSDDLVDLLRDSDVVTTRALTRALDVSERTAQRRLHELVAAGFLRAAGHGRYRPAGGSGALSDDARQLVRIIDELDADAHLTGYDILAPYAHQFAYEYPHLIYCHPPHVTALTAALTSAGWRVLPAGPTARRIPAAERTVILRPQPQTPRSPLDGHLARPEKAWVDMLRETRRSGLPVDFEELGRILQKIERGGGGREALSSYARRTGYLAWVRAARGEQPPDGREQQQLTMGYRA